ncbi:MAG: DUF3237 domain-containing protein [Rhodobacteraceae bacterium]|nr:MAG: DUF3237 domain-containing protein [Paracoccaceae bacterium]
MLRDPELRPVCQIFAELGAPIELGRGKAGLRRIIPISGGTVAGARISGRLLDLGADWQTIFADGSVELDTRYGIETTDGALIDIRNFGFRHGPADVLARVAQGEIVDPGLYYMRTLPRLETGDPRYDWVNRTIFVGTGARFASSVQIKIYEVV